MRIASLAVLMAAGTALSGCAASQLDAIANLGTACTSTTQTLNCGAPTGSGTTGGTTTTTPTTAPNTGNTATIATGDTTLVLESGSLVSTPTNMAVSTLTQTTIPTSTGKIAITTNTSTNGNWPQAKTMDEYVYGSSLGSGIGGTYKEYHQINKIPGSGNSIDEELQVWKWNAGAGSSYATQYRDVTGAGNPARNQAWSFGGNYTTAAQMPTSGSATYSGRFTGEAVTSNFVNPNGSPQTLDRNNRWSVTGDTAITANYGTNGNITGTLTPTEWMAWQTLNSATGFYTTTASDPNAANWFSMAKGGFMDKPIYLAGSIKTNATTTGNTKPNVVTGVAQYDPTTNWVNTTSNSFFNAGFFGSGADNITGVFSMDAQTLAPVGGTTQIHDDRRGYVSMTGIFNACKTGPVC